MKSYGIRSSRWPGLQSRRQCSGGTGSQDFPWLSASRLPELLSYHPVGLDASGGEPLPTHVRNPDGSRLELGGAELDAQLSERLGSRVKLMKLKHGIFDEAAVSVINLATIASIGLEGGLALDHRRFRANLVVETGGSEAFLEDGWVGGRLTFGDGDGQAVVSVTERDHRCVMVNLDPDTCENDVRVAKAVASLNENNAGVYATVVQTGTVRVGDRVSFAAEVPGLG